MLMLANNLIGFWLIPFSLRFLTREEFSLYYIATDLMLWLGIVNLGTSSVFVTRVAQELGKTIDTSRKILGLVNTAFFVQCFFAVIVLLLGSGASFFLPLFFDTGNLTTEFQSVFFILSVSVAITLIGQVFSGLLVASKQIHVDNLIQVVLIVPRIALTILLLKLGYGIIALAYVNLFVSVLGLVIPYFRVRKGFPNLKIGVTFFDRKQVYDFLGNGVWFSIGGVAGILILSMDRFVIGNFVGLALVSNFIITQKLYSVANKVISQVVNVSRPYLAGLFGRNDMLSFTLTYRTLFGFTLVISSFLGTFIFLINKYFIHLWVGEGFYAGDEVNLFLALNFILQVSVLPNRVIGATTLYRIRLHAFIRFAEGVVNLLLSIILAKTIGMVGVVLGSAVTTAIFSNVALTMITQQFFKERAAHFDRRINFSYLAVGLPVLFFALSRISYLSSFVTFFILIVSVGMILFTMRDKMTSLVFVKKVFFRGRLGNS